MSGIEVAETDIWSRQRHAPTLSLRSADQTRGQTERTVGHGGRDESVCGVCGGWTAGGGLWFIAVAGSGCGGRSGRMKTEGDGEVVRGPVESQNGRPGLALRRRK